jgi:hypothetical protein
MLNLIWDENGPGGMRIAPARWISAGLVFFGRPAEGRDARCQARFLPKRKPRRGIPGFSERTIDMGGFDRPG